ncbi:MAG TPA: DUF1403 family protein [Bosea sp. (in: a-proteobacteria)]|jgi:uncharacterized membrane protein|uniref:DUF1403 family protein n=1 Tax=Bosea sp. (in: a-proteobacteria) TaxID=1871050 RepID=UPI002E1194CF|nr:DUF1403 family protein [Bosea sp. (in: a-proteobacteria)]
MRKRPRTLPDPPLLRPPLPRWIRASLAGEATGGIAFLSGAALALLDGPARDEHLIGSLWRQRLALRSGAALARLQGRGEDEATLRDHFYWTRPGHDPGPAGRLLTAWRFLGEAAALRSETWPVRLPTLFDGVGDGLEEAIAIARAPRTGSGDPVAAVAQLVKATLTTLPRQPILALWLADAVLAQRLGWPAAVPLLATQLSRSDLRAATHDAEAWAGICHRAYARAAAAALDLHSELARNARRLLAVAPQLRSKDADRMIARLLSEDALAAGAGPSASDRSGRRLCDRLVALGGVRELTGRGSFRLYGL